MHLGNVHKASSRYRKCVSWPAYLDNRRKRNLKWRGQGGSPGLQRFGDGGDYGKFAAAKEKPYILHAQRAMRTSRDTSPQLKHVVYYGSRERFPFGGDLRVMWLPLLRFLVFMFRNQRRWGQKKFHPLDPFPHLQSPPPILNTACPQELSLEAYNTDHNILRIKFPSYTYLCLFCFKKSFETTFSQVYVPYERVSSKLTLNSSFQIPRPRPQTWTSVQHVNQEGYRNQLTAN